MSDVSLTFFERWFSRRHVGAARPQLIVGVRKGHFVRAFQPFTFLDGSTEEIGSIPGESKSRPWWPKWTPEGDYKYVPGVRTSELHKSFENNGSQSATVTVDNMVVKTRVGLLGRLFRIFKTGGLSPYYGVSLDGRPAQTIEPDEDWHELLDSEAQITVWEGYGDELTKTFSGLIDGPIDMTSQPAVMTIQARDFNQMVTDARLLGNNKSPQLRPPITFVDRRAAENIKAVSGGAVAYDSRPGHPASNVSDLHSSTTWESQGESVTNVTKWVEIHIPRGAYESFFLYTGVDGLEMYASLYVRGTDPKMDGASIPTNDWVDLGLGDVPGAAGGVPFIKHWSSTSDDRGYTHTLGHRFFVGDNTVLRLSFRDLGKSKDDDGNLTYRAVVRRLAAISREIKEEAVTKKWILVDDASDIVKIVLRWAGFREWEVESFGWRLKDKLVFHQGDYLYDLIAKLATYGAFTYFMGDPSEHDLSTGVPVFRYSRARAGTPQLMVNVTDQDFITALSAKLDRGQKAYIIRARGARSKKGFMLGEDTDKRFMAAYRPPWVREGRTAGKIKHETFYDNMLTSNEQCRVACCLIAFQMALAGAQVVVQIPGYPALDIDDQIGVMDEATGTNSRAYTLERTSTHTTGREATWRMTLTGALLDTPDVRGVIEDLNQAVIEAANEEGQ